VGNTSNSTGLQTLADVPVQGAHRSRSPAALEHLFAVDRIKVLLGWQDHPFRRMPPQAL
jgi:hypothetical protein